MAEATKAKALKEYFEANHPGIFQVEEIGDEIHTHVFRSHIQTEGQSLPTALFVDDTIYVMIRVQVATGALKEKNEELVLTYLNEQNRSYKVFKYFLDEEGNIFLDACVPTTDDDFNPELIRVILDVMVGHLTENYSGLMKKIWA